MASKNHYIRTKPYKVQQSSTVLLRLTPFALLVLQRLQHNTQENEGCKVKTNTIISKLLERQLVT